MTSDRTVRLRREAWGFAVGSIFFAVGAVPQYAESVGAVLTNLTFVVGAVFFTLAALTQLALSGREPPRHSTNPANRADWWAAAIQFGGTLLFNVSTTAALISVVDTETRLSDGWRPDAFGSICFLVSSGLAVVATRDRHSLWDRHARTWHGMWLNMAGSVFFAASAVGAYTLPSTDDLVSSFWANLGTFLGALCFLSAALLSRRSIPTGGAPSTTT